MFTTSASRLKSYVQCRTNYYNNYVLKLPQTVDTSSIFGTALHKAIEDKYMDDKNPYVTLQRTITSELERLEGQEILYRYTYNDMVDIGTGILDGYDFTQFAKGLSEFQFSLPLTKDIFIRGIIDRITDDGIIIDYKSAKRKPKDLKSDMQFTIYTWAYQQMYGTLPKHVYWYHLRTHERVEYVFTPELITERMQEVIRVAEKIKDDTFEDKPTERCTACVPWCVNYGK